MNRIDTGIARPAAINALGQVLAAAGILLGVRILTEYLQPAVFGTVMLLVGISLLAVNLGIGPIGHALAHFQPSCGTAERSAMLTHVVAGLLRRVLLWAVLPIVAAVLLVVAGHLSLGDLNGLIAVTLIDSLRTLQVASFNASEQHLRCAGWTVFESWLKPLMAVLCIQVWGPRSDVALLGYAAGGAIAAGIFADRHQLLTWLRQPDRPGAPADLDNLRQRMSSYILPLLPLAAIAWISGLGDRYVLGSLLTMRDVGIYAAAYGLASRPFLMLGAAIELTIRPRYQRAVAAADGRRAGEILRMWQKSILLLGGAGAAALALAPGVLPTLLLAEDYRTDAAHLLPWIGIGYLLLILSQAMERVCYAHGDTDHVLKIALTGAGVALPASLIGVQVSGLSGAAFAVPIAYGAQLLAAYCFARRSLRLLDGRNTLSKFTT